MTDKHLPEMIVFDLDDCLWSPEMHELYGLPSILIREKTDNGENCVVGIKVPNSNDQTVRLFDGARKALYQLATDITYNDVILAAASTSLEPTYSHACLKALEILPGLSLQSMFTFSQIGRTGRLTSRKTGHFKLLNEESGVPYEKMLFFDDCNWDDHVGILGRSLGVVGQRTPRGLQYSEFKQGLDQYRKASGEREKHETV
mmetsp:Transcript_8981/g.10387  ORF Transcript_8981/g.10387 Transcript_8981/m.10387 type:complete len:202 (+) Transcript_8981:41-646(+)